MKILVLSQWYLPEPSIRAHSIARGLKERGHSVCSLTGFPNYPYGRVYSGYRIKWHQRENIDGIPILRVPLYPSHDRSLMRRSLNSLSFAASASLLSPVLCERPDVSWVYSPPPSAAIPLLCNRALFGTPFIYEIQDLWPESIIATGMKPSRWLVSAMHAMNSYIYRRASAIVVISEGFKRDLIKKGVPEPKIRVIPNWVDENLYHPEPYDNMLAAKYGLEGRFNIVFAGNMGMAQALDNVISAAEMMADMPKVQFVLIGSGTEERNLRSMAIGKKLGNIRFIERQPEELIARFFALADVLLIHLRRDPLFDITVPSKTIAYLACEKPILCCVRGDTAKIIEDAGAGLICAPQDPASLADRVREFFCMPEHQRREMGCRARQAFLRFYKRDVLIDRYETLFKEIK